jgi:hypothetical protein
MFGSHLTVSELLIVTNSLNLFRTMFLKEMKYFLTKIAMRFSTLYSESLISMADSESLTKSFQESIGSSIKSII